MNCPPHLPDPAGHRAGQHALGGRAGFQPEVKPRGKGHARPGQVVDQAVVDVPGRAKRGEDVDETEQLHLERGGLSWPSSSIGRTRTASRARPTGGSAPPGAARCRSLGFAVRSPPVRRLGRSEPCEVSRDKLRRDIPLRANSMPARPRRHPPASGCASRVARDKMAHPEPRPARGRTETGRRRKSPRAILLTATGGNLLRGVPDWREFRSATEAVPYSARGRVGRSRSKFSITP